MENNLSGFGTNVCVGFLNLSPMLDPIKPCLCTAFNECGHAYNERQDALSTPRIFKQTIAMFKRLSSLMWCDALKRNDLIYWGVLLLVSITAKNLLYFLKKRHVSIYKNWCSQD